ncbi:chemotaxis-specific protein-glutamate methyltransferase CheB [Sulfitobacter sabulilitoris]|uniref:Protein-glutamate methylesterase/protein-glutamine glutaminase n=1 Tax=Sulfitobacter sabulilitoris TaxID=2562655 RepID=A0A5S3PK39_9RHOB|nr:chemotaxis-specific protein-glutamate methyltransferase CheB [Sulfitobacter sabulilitoris]TMM54671.1 chemotaxis-specific protein-glutamate methyltransferase CheB [Sulfitobacter sabulilitoris]
MAHLSRIKRKHCVNPVNTQPQSDRIGAVKRVAIVDDDAAFRMWVRRMLTADSRFIVVAEAANALEAREVVRTARPDVLTLDVEMPGMNGLEFLARLMAVHPMPVVMMSGRTKQGGANAIHALSIGAVDCIHKPETGCDRDTVRSICDRIHLAACSRVIARAQPVPRPDLSPVSSLTSGPHGQCRRGSLIVIGASTGGVAALETVLHDLAANGPPVMIVQHMPGPFMVSFVERLNRSLPQRVHLAFDGAVLARGDIALAPGFQLHTTLAREDGRWVCRLRPDEGRALHCPSVDVLFASVVEHAKSVSAALLTGLGRDGANSMKQLHDAGAFTIAQDEDSCVVFGMPRAAIAEGAVSRVVPLNRIGSVLRQHHDGPRAPATRRGGQV